MEIIYNYQSSLLLELDYIDKLITELYSASILNKNEKVTEAKKKITFYL